MKILEFGSYNAITDGKKIGSILFLDVEGSSGMWKTRPEEMFDTLDGLANRVTQITENNTGMVVKSIGDAYMCHFDNPIDAVMTAIEFQSESVVDPLKVGQNRMRFRIGISHGEMYEKITLIQNKRLLDYFGNTVNTASRMESKVSEIDEFALAYTVRDGMESRLKSVLEQYCQVSTVAFYNDCKVDHKRSARLLTDEHRYRCEPISKLKGINEVIAYKCKIR